MNGLNIAPDVKLPLSAITETFVILAKRGSGKTYTGCVMAEEMIGAGHPVVIIDPIGVWWGLRSSADGKSDGLPVAIFGGDHADLPLDKDAGGVIADAIVAERFTAILDLSHLSKSAARTFMTAFLERLYHRNRDPLHIFIDEADSFAPQRAADGGQRLLGAMEDLVRRGRARGIGCTLITQRPAVLHKDVLSQAEVLICLRMTGVRDVAAIDEWIKLHDVDDQAAEVKKSLPSLPIGTAWIWSPGWLERLDKVQIRTRNTFDSSATPKIGESRIVPKQMADIDLAALGEKITSTAEEVKANDPKALKAEVARLKRELENAQVVPDPVVEQVEVSVLTDDDRATLDRFGVTAAEAVAGFEQITELLKRISTAANPTNRPVMVSIPRLGGDRDRTVRGGPAVRPTAPKPSAPVDTDGAPLRKGAVRILQTFADMSPSRLTISQLGQLAKFKTTGGTFKTYWGEIRRRGYLDEGPVDITLSQAGFDFLGIDPPGPMTRDETLTKFREVLRAGERNILDQIVDADPSEVSIDDIAEYLGMTASGGTFKTYVGNLKRNRLIDVTDGVATLHPELTALA